MCRYKATPINGIFVISYIQRYHLSIFPSSTAFTLKLSIILRVISFRSLNDPTYSMAALWADTPFKLIPTPEYAKPKDADANMIWIATEMALAHNGLLRGLNSMYLQAPHVKLEADIYDLCTYAGFWLVRHLFN